MRRLRLSVPLVLACAAAFLAACSGDDGGTAPEPIRVHSVAVTPATATATSFGETVAFQAEARDAAGNRVQATVTWISDNPGVATVDPTSGQATAVSNGTATIRASAQFTDQGVTSTAEGTGTLTVGQQGASLELSATSVQVVRGTADTLTARVVDARGNPVPGQTITWSSADASVASVVNGIITGVAEGTTQVTATAGSLSGTVAVTVVGPPADRVILTPAGDTITVGDTLRFTATVLAADGDTLQADSVKWASSDTAVATVDASGLATGVAPGSATLTVRAWDGGAEVTAQAALLVIEAIPDFQPSGDTTLVGNVEVANLTVPAGVKVTLAAEATVTALGNVTIAGTLEGNCTPFAVQAAGRITISGAVTTTCAAPPAEGAEPGLTIVTGSGFTLDGADIRAGGKVTLRSEGAANPAARRAPAPVDRLMPFRTDEEQELGCSLFNTRVTAADGQNFKDEKKAYGKGLNGGYGADIEIHCGRERLVISGGSFQAGKGGSGENAESRDAATVAEGGAGREGGGIFLSSEIAVHFTNVRGNTSLFPGSGGDGGDATAEGWPTARAVGGAGGPGGTLEVWVPATHGLIYIEPGAVQIVFGEGGFGGDAAAEGLPGADATATEAAKKGGDAFATGGAGGNTFPEGSPQLVGDILVGPVQSVGNVLLSSGGGGFGGDAAAVAGFGGLGSAEFPNGGDGGDMHAEGGVGGSMVVRNNGADYSSGAVPGRGGPAFFHNGRGGPGFNGCSVNPWVAGGNGGVGGDTSGSDGKGGTSETGEQPGLPGGVTIQDAGEGGLGQDGSPPGKGGSGGTDHTTSHGQKEVLSSFEPGDDGEQCTSQTAMSTSLSVNRDPGGHDQYVGFRVITALTLLQIAANQFSLTGGAPWVALLGAIDPTGILRMSGLGTVAGFQNVSVVLAVVLARNLGLITGFSGTVTAGAEGELPGGESIVYDITGTATGGGNFQIEVRDPATGERVDPAAVGLGGLVPAGSPR